MPAPRIVSPETATMLIDAYRAGGRIVEIGKPFGYDYKTVRRVLTENGVGIRNVGSQKRAPLIADINQVMGWVNSGESCHRIAQRLGTYPTKVIGFLRNHGHEASDGRYRRGVANPLSKVR